MAPGADGRNLLWIRPLASLEPRPLPGTENVSGAAVFWSPDNRFIAFQAGTKLRKIDISGRPPQDICDTSVFMLGGAWNRDDVVIFGTVGNGIMQVPASGGVRHFHHDHELGATKSMFFHLSCRTGDILSICEHPKIPAFMSARSMLSRNNRVPSVLLPHRSWLVMHRPMTELSASCFSCARVVCWLNRSMNGDWSP